MKLVQSMAFLVLMGLASAFSGRHRAHEDMLQVPPSFARDGVYMYPALHPEHDPQDHRHLVPEDSKELYYSQEGHRPPLHGAKHGRLYATFSRPTVVLEHSSHIKEVKCGNRSIDICFSNSEAMHTVENAWKKYNASSFNLVTYHHGCGHLTGEYRSFFVASRPSFHGNCTRVATTLSDEQEIHDGDLNWGTYRSPHINKRQPVKGHVKASKADTTMRQYRNIPHKLNGTGDDLQGLNETFPRGTVDLTKNASAVLNFFGTNASSINIDIPDEYEIGLDYLSDEDYNGLAKRVKKAVEIIVKIAVIAAKIVMVVFGVPFEEEYHADIKFDYTTGGSKLPVDFGSFGGNFAGSANDAKALLHKVGLSETNFVLSKPGAGAMVVCNSCGAKGNLSFEGALSFSITKGVYRARVSLNNHDPFIFDAIFNITTDAKAFKDKAGKGGINTVLEKELYSVALSPLTIPKVITIGPQVSVNAAASNYVDSHAEFIAGGRFSIAPGEIALDIQTENNKASGFNPSFQPIFEFQKGNVIATADLALPVGIELAIDVLTGTWKKAIGVYTAPSLYLTAGYSYGEKHACDNGIELRAGAKNRIYSSALGIWEYEFKNLGFTFYETGFGCISKQGWNSSQVEDTDFLKNTDPNASTNATDEVLQKVSESVGGEQNLASNKTLQLTPPQPVIYEDEHFSAENKDKDKNKLRKLPKTNGFRLIQDAGQTATLVSGKDGHIYLANNSAEYDISAPWGGLEVDKNIFTYDVFGRLIWIDARAYNFHMIEMGVSRAENMPKEALAA
ncbi:hypothetical protein N7466_011149 [Penicillium verhagenii]|uniref:uncharacterized protein n=1 Tax=Penicillium verhagenii TaxID=1562060 RepID=UPI0025450F53|nr:uncharacterized protein N7466_011149 [Penicillium verhagenii]KAJ5917595.1 hypothetical protein N7466_011149 [Penicillium verhagenii]